jgi:predicted RNA-binding protein with PIN domain
VIERLAAKYAKQFTIRVCTADRMIWETVRAFEAHWISPDDLRYEWERAEGELQRRIFPK